jgi:hypothetical protein
MVKGCVYIRMIIMHLALNADPLKKDGFPLSLLQ